LHAADMPLIYGLSNVTCETTREAVSLAEMVGAVIDSHTSL
jgi:formylmethanofuran dehydrogenase subunit B